MLLVESEGPAMVVYKCERRDALSVNRGRFRWKDVRERGLWKRRSVTKLYSVTSIHLTIHYLTHLIPTSVMGVC